MTTPPPPPIKQGDALPPASWFNRYLRAARGLKRTWNGPELGGGSIPARGQRVRSENTEPFWGKLTGSANLYDFAECFANGTVITGARTGKVEEVNNVTGLNGKVLRIWPEGAEYLTYYPRVDWPCSDTFCVQLYGCGAPLVGKDVHVTGPGGYDQTVATNSQGLACFNGVTPGTYTVHPPTVAGYLSESDVVVVVTGECGGDTTIIKYRRETYKVCVSVRSCTRCDQTWDWLDGIRVEASIGGVVLGECLTGDGSGVGCQQEVGDFTCCIEFAGSYVPKSGTIDVVIVTKNWPPGYAQGECTITLSIDSCFCNPCAIELPLASGYVCGCCGPVKATLQVFDAGHSGTISVGGEGSIYPCAMCRAPHCMSWAGSISWTEPEAARCIRINGVDCCLKAESLVTVSYILTCDPVTIETSSGPQKRVLWTLCRTWIICAKFDPLLPVFDPDGGVIWVPVIVCGTPQRAHARLLGIEEASSEDCFGYWTITGDKLTFGPTIQGCDATSLDLVFEPDCTKLCDTYGLCFEPYLPDELRDTIIIQD